MMAGVTLKAGLTAPRNARWELRRNPGHNPAGCNIETVDHIGAVAAGGDTALGAVA
jgi:hypothetical protein